MKTTHLRRRKRDKCFKKSDLAQRWMICPKKKNRGQRTLVVRKRKMTREWPWTGTTVSCKTNSHLAARRQNTIDWPSNSCFHTDFQNIGCWSFRNNIVCLMSIPYKYFWVITGWMLISHDYMKFYYTRFECQHWNLVDNEFLE